MKLNINRFGLKFAMVLMLLLCAKVASAENRLYIDKFSLTGNEVSEVAVLLDNSDEIGGVQFQIKLSDGLELAGVPTANTERIENRQLAFRNNMVLITSSGKQTVAGNSGAIVYLPVRLKQGASFDANYSIDLFGIVLSSKTGSPVEAPATSTTPIEVVTGKANAFVDPAEGIVNNGEEFSIPVYMNNTCPVLGMQINVKVPAGFTVEDAEAGSRTYGGVQVFERQNGVYGIVIADLMGGEAVEGNSGVVFTLKVKAPAEFTAEKAQIEVYDLIVSTTGNKSVYGKPASSVYAITNGETAYQKALAEIAALESELKAAVENVAEVAPDVKDSFTGASIAESIEALKEAVDAAYADHSLTTSYDSVMTPVTGIRSDIEALVPAAMEAERVFKNKAAYDEALALIAGLEEQFNALKAEIAEKYPNANVEDMLATAASTLTGLKEAADEDYKNAEKTGSFVFPDPTEDITAGFEAIRAEAARQQSNYNFYMEDKEMIAYLNTLVDETVASLKEGHAYLNLTAAAEALKAEFAELAKQLDEAYAAVATEGTFKFDFNMGAYESKVTKVLGDEAARQISNKEAYDAAKAQIAELQGALDAAKAEIAKTYPAANVADAAAAIAKDIEALTAAAAEAYEAVAAEGNFDYTVDGKNITDAINSMTVEAKRQQNNYTLYTADKARINALYGEVTKKAAALTAQYPGINLDTVKASLNAAIAAALRGADEAYAKVAAVGMYVYNFDVDAFKARINSELTAEATRQADNKANYDETVATLQGMQQMLDEAKAEIAASYANADVAAALEAVQTNINNALAGAAEAYAAVTHTGTFKFDINYGSIENAINAAVAEAKRQQNNYDLYQEVKAQIAALYEMLDEKVAALKQQYAGIDLTATAEALKAKFAEADKAAAEAYAAVATDGNFRFDFDMSAYENMINNDLAAEAKRQADNKANYDETVATLQGMQGMLDEAKATVASDYAGADVTALVEQAQNLITTGLAGAAEAYTAVAAEGDFKFDINYGDIENVINKIVPEAKRLTENKAVYDETIATLQGMQEMLDEAKASVAKNYPAANVDAQIEAAQKAINDGIAGANEAYAAVAAEGNFKFDINYGSIEALIAAIEAEAKRQVGNNNAYNDILKAIETLQTKLDMAKMTATQIYPESDVTAAVAAAQAAIDQAKADALKAKEEAGAEGEIKYTVPAEEIEALIAKVLAEAKRQADNSAAYKAVENELAALQGKLDAAKATVAADYEGVNVEALVEAAQKAITDAETAAAAAKEAVAAEGTFTYEVPAADIEAAIAAIIAEAKRQDGNAGAYEAVEAELNNLQGKLDAVKATVEAEYEGVDVDALVAAAQLAIDNAETAAEAAKEAAGETGTFTYEVPAADIEAAINAVLDEAKRQSGNKAAYNAVLDELTALQSQLDAAKAEAEKDYEGSDIDAVVAAAQKAITDAKAAADAAKIACAEEGQFTYTLDEEAIKAAIAAVVPEAKRQADNKAAYNAVIDELIVLQGQLDAAKAEAAKDYEGFDVSALVDEAQKAINDAKAAAMEEKVAVAGEGSFAYTLDKETIEAAIAAIVPEAKRLAGNKAAYDAAIAEIDALQAAYDAAVKEVAEKYPGVDVKEFTDKAKDAIDAARLGADDAYAAVAQEGEFEYTVNKADIEALINDILEEAEKISGIDAVLIEDLGGNVKFYNLNGVQITTPAPGSVVIAVGANGQTRKILVK